MAVPTQCRPRLQRPSNTEQHERRRRVVRHHEGTGYTEDVVDGFERQWARLGVFGAFWKSRGGFEEEWAKVCTAEASDRGDEATEEEREVVSSGDTVLFT